VLHVGLGRGLEELDVYFLFFAFFHHKYRAVRVVFGIVFRTQEFLNCLSGALEVGFLAFVLNLPIRAIGIMARHVEGRPCSWRGQRADMVRVYII
jgi:hypothetical protein